MLTLLARASMEGAALVILVWIAVRTLRLSPATRTLLWWCAGVKFLAGLWIAPLAIPLLPGSPVPSAIEVTAERLPAAAAGNLGAAGPANANHLRKSSPARSVSAESLAWLAGRKAELTAAILLIWAAGVLVSLALGVRRWQRTRRAVQRSTPASAQIEAMAAELARDLALSRRPAVRLSVDVNTPLVTGFTRPVVLLPAGAFMRMPPAHQAMALCHELAHVKRGDLWLGCAPAAAECLFFFHPLVHLAAREYAFWREAACDAAVLAAMDAPPQEYGRLLLDLGVARPRPGLAAAGASWSFTSLKRRIVMLRHPLNRSTRSRLIAAALVTVSVAAILPLRLVARPAAPATERLAAVPAIEPAPALPALQRARTGPPEEKPAGLNFVMFFDDHTTTMSGSMRDIERARRFRRSGERILWFRQGGREYVVRDTALLDRVAALWVPVNELGEQQGKLGEKQGALGAKQGELGERQGELGAEQGRLGERQGRLGERQGVLANRESRRMTERERAAFDREHETMEREMRDLDRKMEALNDRMREFDKPMRELDEQMEALNGEMEALGEQMEAASKKAEREMHTLIERAVASGAAEVVK